MWWWWGDFVDIDKLSSSHAEVFTMAANNVSIITAAASRIGSTDFPNQPSILVKLKLELDQTIGETFLSVFFFLSLVYLI